MREKIKLGLVFDDGEITFSWHRKRVTIGKETKVWNLLKEFFESSVFDLVVEYEGED